VRWREKLAILVTAATERTYTEIWNLPSGATFRISGRPHPDGALAFLFEDMTAEISMSRQFCCRIGITPRTFQQSRRRNRYLLNFW